MGVLGFLKYIADTRVDHSAKGIALTKFCKV